MQSTVHRNFNHFINASGTTATDEEVEAFCGQCERYADGTCDMGMNQQVSIGQNMIGGLLSTLMLDPDADKILFSEVLQTSNGATNQQRYAKRNYCKFRTVDGVDQERSEQPADSSV